jgi:NlpC/P60 family
VIKAALVAAAALALGACATTVPDQPPPNPHSRAYDGGILMIDSASAMLGQPYRYGGAVPGGFDCSGLVVYAAAGAGIRVPRTAAEQYDFGVPIPRADLRAGDLIFMHLAHKELHVAIAIDPQRFIHAPSTGGFVRIDSLDSPPYSRAYLGARRVIPRTRTEVSFGSPQQGTMP